MTKKDYEAIAEVLRKQAYFDGEGSEGESTCRCIAESLADLMAADNPRFDRSRFLAACRGEDSKDSAGRTVKYASR